MAVKVKEFQAFLGKVDEKINEFLKENKIKRSQLIDIKYVALATAGTMALVVYDDGKK